MSSECQGEMLDYRRMLMEDFSLSPEIILSCRGEIEHHCSGLHRKGRTLHCLMKVVRGEKGNLGMNCQQAVRTDFPLPLLMLQFISRGPLPDTVPAHLSGSFVTSQ